MNTTRMDAILAELKPEEVKDCLWMIDVFERWNMPPEETDEWRRRIVARQQFLDFDADSPDEDAALITKVSAKH